MFWGKLFAALTSLAILGSMTQGGTPAGGGPAQNSQFGLYIRSHRVSVTIQNQLATTKIEQVFVNEGSAPAEGTYLFPLPEGAAVSDLTLYIDGQPIKGKILDADQAKQIYTEIVRQMRDPVLLQYVGRSAIQANIFPIPARSERKIEITYSHIAPADNGLIHYTYPLRADYASRLPVREVSVSLSVESDATIGTVYSPNPLVGINRTGDRSFRAGMEAYNYRATDDFTVYYSVANNEISANLLTYRASANEEGFFLLLVTPPTKVDSSKIIPKDVTIVLDQSGSMSGVKWDQAKAAVAYVLKRLNAEDRFNAVVFSSGYRLYAKTPQPPSDAENAIKWINGLEANGGTDINAALTSALESADTQRQTVILFLTDGLPTEGVTDSKMILENFRRLAPPNVRLFSFGVGDDVDTFLLDSLSSNYGGTSAYVRPNEDIENKVSSVYNKITSPVLNALKLDYDGVILEEMLPGAPLPDLFAGSQLVISGRYRDGGNGTITLTGDLNGTPQTFTYRDLNFPINSGGQPFVARLWAQRKIGALLNQIRLNGETKELVDSVVALSIRFGIITPYTSYLIQEDDIARRMEDRDRGGGDVTVPSTPMPMHMMTATAAPSQAPVVSGAGAVERADKSNELAAGDKVMVQPTAEGYVGKTEVGEDEGKGSAFAGEVIKNIRDRAFVLRNGVWVDTQYTSAEMEKVEIKFLSDEYFALIEAHPEIAEFLALGDHVLVVIEGKAYEIMPE
ncbi:MAG: VWA domain-containing protein [Anaerolinea sp.]|nr:VWA domain-containing protein [Anaerolinea sp.]MCC6974476.1 VWA domain-containing protein [Anaerolineae bacterium]CAG1003377.1 hypothetical protein ANRL4_03351 [Anaerolineae bacterium]